MHKTSKIVLAVCAAAIILILGWFILNRYAYSRPDVRVTFLSTTDDSGNSITMLQVEIDARSSMGVSEEWNDRYFEAYAVIDEMMAVVNSHRGAVKYNFDSKVEIVGGRTRFTVFGECLEAEGEEPERVEEEFYLDYVLTEDIEEH